MTLAEFHPVVIFALAIGFGMSCAVGANDVANAMGTSVGSRIITIRQAIVIAAIFEALGAASASGQVTMTLRSGIFDVSYFANAPMQLAYAMLAALMASFSWLCLATYFRWPVSTTHSIVGALMGVGALIIGMKGIKWSMMRSIFASWIVLPLFSGGLSYIIFRMTQNLIFLNDSPIKRVKLLMPVYMSVVVFSITYIAIEACLPAIGVDYSAIISFGICLGVAFLTFCIGVWLMTYYRVDLSLDYQEQYKVCEKAFGVLAVITACAMAFSHGSNDVANAIGPLAAIVELVHSGALSESVAIPWQLTFFGAAGVVIGLGVYGYRIIETVGTQITSLTASRSFAAQFATALMIVIASGVGLPVSSTQTLVGAVLGVGIARGIGALNLKVIRNIFMSWLVTLPAGAVLVILFYRFLTWYAL